MTTEQFNKLDDIYLKAQYLIDNMCLEFEHVRTQTRINLHKLHDYFVAVVNDADGQFSEMIAFTSCTDALNFVTFRSLKIFS